MGSEKIQILKSLLDALPEGIVSMDAYGNITTINRGVIELLGYNSINLVGRPIFELLPSFEREGMKGLFKQLESIDSVRNRKVRLYDVKGRLRSLEISMSPLRGEGGKPVGVVSVMRDIKDVTNLEKEVEELKDFS